MKNKQLFSFLKTIIIVCGFIYTLIIVKNVISKDKERELDLLEKEVSNLKEINEKLDKYKPTTNYYRVVSNNDNINENFNNTEIFSYWFVYYKGSDKYGSYGVKLEGIEFNENIILSKIDKSRKQGYSGGISFFKRISYMEYLNCDVKL